jgi:hypothetical protein
MWSDEESQGKEMTQDTEREIFEAVSSTARMTMKLATLPAGALTERHARMLEEAASVFDTASKILAQRAATGRGPL